MGRKFLGMGSIAILGLTLTLPRALIAEAARIVEMKDAGGQSVGSAALTDQGKSIQITYDFKGLPPGSHALHIHQNAKCDADPAAPADAFKSAGGHFNPEHKQHGLDNPAGPHAGDMPNFTVGSDGTAHGIIENPRVTIRESNDLNSLFANGGTALVVHAKEDDMKTDPAGNAGTRIACGVIAK